ncbi:MAG: aminopeptidase [Spirochaetaceae bacterium]|jgi:leucyl aminopeptidase (aminopeptidase T)|nr:aminopeptidase [Spirochaetaceae bacterium]
MKTALFETMMDFDADLARAARIAINESLRVRAGEQVLIITNPAPDVSVIAAALYDAALQNGARPLLIYQDVKTQFDFAESGVIAAFGAKPEVVISVSAEKLGKDAAGIASPYRHDGREYDHIFHLQQYGLKTCRAFWSPSTTAESFARTVPVDYALLKARCAAVKAVLDRAEAVRITAPGGTDIMVPLAGRTAFSDDGDFSAPGSGGNLPAGETFISPQNGAAHGVIAFDGSITLCEGDIVIETPVRCTVTGGLVTAVDGGREARLLLETITGAETRAGEFETAGKLPAGAGERYARNARNIGELGIGLNPAARISGHMLEDEKAFRTCHFAIGSNYDDDAPALIHLDGLVKAPTITAYLPGGGERIIEQDGDLAIPVSGGDEKQE